MDVWGTQKFGSEIEGEKNGAPPPPQGKGQKKGKPGVMEGFTLFMQHQYVRGIFALSCLFMVEVTILDYIMKVRSVRTSRLRDWWGEQTASLEAHPGCSEGQHSCLTVEGVVCCRCSRSVTSAPCTQETRCV